MNWPNLFLGILFSFLPKAWWRSWRPLSTVDLGRAAVLSGLLECAAFTYLLVRGYSHFLVVRTHQLQAAADTNPGTQLYLLLFVSLEYVFHPLSLMCLYLAGEGALRAWAAYFTDEVIPSLPLRLVVFLQDRSQARKLEAERGPEIPDLCERVCGDVELRISSQRPKEGWRPSIAVAVEGEFHEIVTVETQAGTLPFVYTLRKLPAGRIIRGAYRYDPPSGR